MNTFDARPSFTAELDPSALIDGDLFTAFAAGELPVARLVHVARIADDHDLALPGGRVVRSVTWQHTRWTLVEGPDWRVRFRADSDGETWAWIFGTRADVVERLATRIGRWNVPVETRADSVEITFCYCGSRGVVRRRRAIDASPWPAIAPNYSLEVRDGFDRLVGCEPADLDGRLVLLWGPPGTGKTTLLRTLARQWAAWCDTLFISDPDRLFNDPTYLNEVMFDGGEQNGADGETPRWMMLLLEDCDELIRPDAKHASGQALSRLLNLTDGMVGHGLRTLVCLTTNEELWRLHPAVTRPGRCLAQIEVDRLSPAESARWLRDNDVAAQVDQHIGPDGATLAELFALRNGRPVTLSATTGVGQYL